MLLGLHRCKVCGCRWLLWPDVIHGGGWNLLDTYSKPGACCDNAPMGEQIEHLRDIPLTISAPTGAATPPQPTAEWQPIETAPKDGTNVLIFDKAWCGGLPKVSVSYWLPYKTRDGRGDEPWVERGSWSGVTKPTHWMPLPEAPK